ncbi:hypothetical protein OpiT1DRAFT_02229 [Opitutaceae bacterium TAV1]|nr:hypothetical protein OpiT1DRAFT_02229 [Opitutaceae bacterium TAV1]
MPSGDQQIRINALLLEREALFVRVHDLERAAAKILGEEYPFTRPLLPSDVKAKTRPKKKPARAPATDPLRKLEPGETAWRVTWTHAGQEYQETHDNADALRTLLASQGGQLRVTRLETVDAAGDTRAVLLGSNPEEDKP